ncbi:MAG: type II secretion system protein GspD [Pirellulales bacterium]|nr:type II secretion system protein GspD [Pirellulales bacterium]
MRAQYILLLAARGCVRQACLRVVLAVVVAIFTPLSVLHAQEPSIFRSAAEGQLKEKLQKHGDLTLRNTTLGGALFTISELWDINLVVGDDVKGQVNGEFEKAPLHEILDAILLSHGYSYRIVGESLVVMPLDELGRINPLFDSVTLTVHGGNVREIVEGAKLLSSPQGQIHAIESARSIMILDFPDRVAMIRAFVQNIDAHSVPVKDEITSVPQTVSIMYLTPDFIEPSSVKDAIEAVLSEDGKAAIIDKERKIVVVDYPSNLARASDVVKQVDIPRPQVRIHALVYDISLQDVERLGINWNHAVKGRTNDQGEPQTVFDIDSVTSIPFQAGTEGAALTFASLSESFDITAVVLALQTANDARLLADPNVTVEDNEEAMFESISEIPYQELTQTAEGGQIGTTAFRDAGIKLMVKPRIARDGTIQMHVEPEVSRLSGFTPEDNQPIIDTRKAATTVRVANRQTLVIGGLRQRSDTGNFNGVPGFKDVRILGNLFRARETDVRESELIVFIMPEIIGYDDPPKPRQMAAAETTLHRLNQIPVAEGRLSCEACGDGYEAGAADGTPYQHGSEEILFPGDASEPKTDSIPSMTRRDSDPWPQRRASVLQNGVQSAKVQPPQISPNPSLPESGAVPSRVVQVPKSSSHQMRIAYQDRFRSTGGIYPAPPSLQEPARSEKKPQQAPDSTKAQKNWLQRVLRL